MMHSRLGVATPGALQYLIPHTRTAAPGSRLNCLAPTHAGTRVYTCTCS